MEAKNKPFVRIRLDFLLDVQRGSYEKSDLLVLSALKMSSNFNFGCRASIVTVDMILSMCNMSKQHKSKTMIMDSLFNLKEGGLIELYGDMMFENVIEDKSIKSTDLIYVKFGRIEDNKDSKFSMVFIEDIVKMLKLGEKNPSKLLYLYSFILGGIYDKGTRYNMISIADVSEQCDIDKKTATKYVQMLHDAELLYKTKKAFIESGITKTINVYTRFCYKDEVEARMLR